MSEDIIIRIIFGVLLIVIMVQSIIIRKKKLIIGKFRFMVDELKHKMEKEQVEIQTQLDELKKFIIDNIGKNEATQ